MTVLSPSAAWQIFPADAPVQVVSSPSETHLVVPEGVEAALVERFPPTERAASATPLRVRVSDGAKLTHCKILHVPTGVEEQSFVEAHVGAGAAYRSFVVLAGGGVIRNTIHVRLDGAGAECALNGLFIGRGRERLETHTLIEHRQPHGTSREFYKGILDDEAQGVFDGLIVVQKEAQKTDSVQTSRNLLLSPRARANANPELKIYANDVKCKHGATIGQIDADQLFYLRSRGVPQSEARRLLIHAFAHEMIELVEPAALQPEIAALIDAQFHV